MAKFAVMVLTIGHDLISMKQTSLSPSMKMADLLAEELSHV
jgi:hypothetical protein